MSRYKHSPGPWYIEARFSPVYCQYTGEKKPDSVTRWINDHYDSHVALMSTFASDNESANAVLIAAAPDLLQELRFMVIQCCGSVEDPSNPNCMQCLMARNAIAKAEGRTP